MHQRQLQATKIIDIPGTVGLREVKTSSSSQMSRWRGEEASSASEAR